MRALHVLRLIVLLLPVRLFAQPAPPIQAFTERTPAYFTDRYGFAKSSKTFPKYVFLHPGRGNVEISGQFSVKEFRSGDLRVESIFHLPSLKLAAVKLHLPRQWTREQNETALAAYGAEWKPVSGNPALKLWITPNGVRAISILNSLEIQSAAVIQATERALQDADAKRKAIPKF